MTLIAGAFSRAFGFVLHGFGQLDMTCSRFDRNVVAVWTCHVLVPPQVLV
ncbi:hypothetical protein JQX09_22230 [Sulfitobacter pseudonitzschiae]|nr:hypothetical protein [Pseudosulfitobacter pseudonitzschiae]MBM1839500.1 hypothetical protein [Pseudosulfitobacter pseudonitzschiae]MBM1849185.1 hypothetical protein [Pseudosulfitobacter pseudonitzschiae]MBM1878238.1 hypothetical protein [Pseudosulfitobacter pseudonitzschiae]MBM1897678.1 hypothetical protein [Pseudosulfitobacter pseudonitzschiae]MBM1907386.1 hypothetical protein [Pseudosulfitobacter pseudonitzschiae]